MRSYALPPALALLLLAGCDRGSDLGFDRFVNTTVELRKLSTQAPNAADFAARKRTLEARLGVSDADLDRYARDHAHDVKLMSAAWDSIEARLSRADTTRKRRTVPRYPGAPPGAVVVPGGAIVVPPGAQPPLNTTGVPPAGAPAPAPPKK